MGNEQTGTLIALGFDDPYKADEARAALLRMAGEGLLKMEETAVLAKTADEKIRISQDTNVVANDQKVGHVLGLVTAAVTGTMPFIMAGTLAGRLVGRFTDHGVTNQFINQVKQQLQPGTSALLLYGRSDPERREMVIERLRQWNPRILQSDMPPELEQEIKASVQGP